ncbi:Ig-like domain-containing protein [Eubacteriaceae bacterium ES3]|nr:Ig-like domain-containing protein [Eubacteriaceae bacterium ES3]
MIKKFSLITGLLLGLLFFSSTVSAEESPLLKTNSISDFQVDYHTHIQNIGWEWDWITDGNTSGTFGKGLRLEGIQIKLTGNIPEGASIEYRTQVQNLGWEQSWTTDAETSGTTGLGYRLEAIQIRLVDCPGYHLEYRTHIQNLGWEQTWSTDGETSGTVGKSLRLEGIQIKLVKDDADLEEYDALLEEIDSLKSYQYTDYSWDLLQTTMETYAVTQRNTASEVTKAVEKITQALDNLESLSEATVYDEEGTYGSSSSSSPQVIAGNVIIDEEDIILKNMVIKGNLIIGEGVGSGDCTLENVVVYGETYIRGGGDNSIHINGGDYNDIIIQRTASGSVRVVTTLDGLEVVIAEDASEDSVILEGNFTSVTLEGIDVDLTIAGSSVIDELIVKPLGLGSMITVEDNATISDLYVNGPEVTFYGLGDIEWAEVTARDVSFEKAPDTLILDDNVDIDVPVMVEAISVSGYNGASTIKTDGGTLQMLAELEPEDADNQDVTWSVVNSTGEATISSSGLLTAVKNGTVTVYATAKDGSRISGSMSVVITNQTEPTISAASSTIVSGTVDPKVVLTLTNDTFTTTANLNSYWTISTGTTGLALNTITRDLSSQVTISFIGTAVPGTISIQAGQSALSGGQASNAIELTVPTVAVTSVSLSASTMALTTGGATGSLTTTVLPTNATIKTVSWSSQDTSVATVTAGKVTPVSEGRTYIIATTTDGQKTASCLVTVTDAETEPYMTALTAVLDDDSEVQASGETLSLTLEQNTLTKSISVVMNEKVKLGTDPTVYFNGTNVVYGTISLDTNDTSGKTIIITPGGSNGTAALLGTFTFNVPAGALLDMLDHGNEATSFNLTVIPVETLVPASRITTYNTTVDGVTVAADAGVDGRATISFSDSIAWPTDQEPNVDLGGDPNYVYVDLLVLKPEGATQVLIDDAKVALDDQINGTLPTGLLFYYPVAVKDSSNNFVGISQEKTWNEKIYWYDENDVLIAIENLEVYREVYGN